MTTIPQNILERLTAQQCEEFPEAEFSPLGDEVAKELTLLYEEQARFLADAWKTDQVIPPRRSDPNGEDIEAWKHDLSKSRVGAYLSGAAGLMRRLLLKSEGETLRIESPHEEPYLEVQSAPGSSLARESMHSDSAVRVYLPAVSQHIALRCDVPTSWGEYAWRSIVVSLPGAAEALPKLVARESAAGVIAVSLAR